MHRLLTFSLILFGAAAAAAPPRNGVDKRFIGPWRLISIEGRMSVQIAVKADRKPFAAGKGSVEEKAAAYDSYLAYYGTYAMDTKAGTVTHHREDPLQQGPDHIVLMPVEDGKGGTIPRQEATNTLTWERIR